MEITNNNCNTRVSAYRNGKTMDQCKNVARKNSELLSDEISKNGQISWTRILEVAHHDELIYKLTLKYLRLNGFDIGNNSMPRVKPLNIG
jgi:hypothetical protein